jgi:hypothetical protein
VICYSKSGFPSVYELKLENVVVQYWKRNGFSALYELKLENVVVQY